jgi:hypothetical protein
MTNSLLLSLSLLLPIAGMISIPFLPHSVRAKANFIFVVLIAAASLGKLLNFIVLEEKKYKEIQPQEIFPAGRKHSSHYNDFFVTKIFDGVVDRILYSMNFFQFIQNGKIQMYILYGIFFIVLVFLGTVFKLI